MCPQLTPAWCKGLPLRFRIGQPVECNIKSFKSFSEGWCKGRVTKLWHCEETAIPENKVAAYVVKCEVDGEMCTFWVPRDSNDVIRSRGRAQDFNDGMPCNPYSLVTNREVQEALEVKSMRVGLMARMLLGPICSAPIAVDETPLFHMQQLLYESDATLRSILANHTAPLPGFRAGMGLPMLCFATLAPSVECVRLLLSAGADVDAQCSTSRDIKPLHEQMRWAGYTSLMLAVQFGDVDTADILLHAGADAQLCVGPRPVFMDTDGSPLVADALMRDLPLLGRKTPRVKGQWREVELSTNEIARLWHAKHHPIHVVLARHRTGRNVAKSLIDRNEAALRDAQAASISACVVDGQAAEAKESDVEAIAQLARCISRTMVEAAVARTDKAIAAAVSGGAVVEPTSTSRFEALDAPIAIGMHADEPLWVRNAPSHAERVALFERKALEMGVSAAAFKPVTRGVWAGGTQPESLQPREI